MESRLLRFTDLEVAEIKRAVDMLLAHDPGCTVIDLEAELQEELIRRSKNGKRNESKS